MSEFARELTDLIKSLAAESGDTDSAWGQVCELGLAGIGVPEGRGGSGGSLADLIVVIRELARAGLGTPIVEASTAAYAMDAAAGEQFDTIVVAPDLNLASKSLTARLPRVPFADKAAALVIVASSAVGRVALAGESVTVETDHDIAGLPYGGVQLDHAPVEHVPAGPTVAQIGDRLALARSAALLGSAWAAYELTRSYVLQREQFGAPLVKIPAVSSALAQMTVRTRFAQSALDRATAACAATDVPDTHRFGAVSAARIGAAAAATLVARTSHQLHGAVGITAEYDLHRHTSTLWALRDADQSEFDYCRRLGARVRDEGEIELWESISA